MDSLSLQSESWSNAKSWQNLLTKPGMYLSMHVKLQESSELFMAAPQDTVALLQTTSCFKDEM